MKKIKQITILIALSIFFIPILFKKSPELAIACISLTVLLIIIKIILNSPTAKGFIGEFIVSRAIAKTSSEDKEQYIINNLILKDENGKTSQIDHLIINQSGIYVIETKNYKGTIYGDEQDFNWIQELNNGKQYEFYSPVKQNLTHINMVRKTIQMQVPMYSIIVFIKGNIDNVNSNKVYRLKSFIENIKHYEKIKISVETVEEIYTILKDYKDNPRATIKEHINNINKF